MSPSGGGSQDDDDQLLARRCLAGEEDAWRALVGRHRRGLITLAQRIVPHGQAEDVVDAVVADLWERRKLNQYQGRSTLATWLGAAVINAALNARRATASRSARLADASTSSEAATASDAPDSRLAGILSDAIASLPEEMRTLVLMYYEQGLTLDEASVVFGPSKSALSRQLRQARERILLEARQLAQNRCGTTLEALRGGADLADIELDLREACSARRDRPRDRREGPVSNA